MRCLVTGGAGFIASHLAEALRLRNHEVVLFDNCSAEYDPAVKRRNAAETGAPLVEGDIRDTFALTGAMRDHRIEAVFHLAALPGVRLSMQEPQRCMDINVQGTVSVLESARQTGIQKLIFASSSSVYGSGMPMPFQEDRTTTLPISPYAASKLAGENLCRIYAQHFPTVVTRLFTVFGPRQRPDLAFYKFLHAVAAGRPIPRFGDGSSRRDYTYCTDAAAGLASALHLDTPFDILNIASGRAIPLTEVIAAIETVTGRTARLEPFPSQAGDMDATFADISKAARLLGYAPRVSLLDGLQAQWQWQAT